MTQILKALAIATTGLGLLLASAPLNAQQCSPDEINCISVTQNIRDLWVNRLNKFEGTAISTDTYFAYASEAIAFQSARSAMARRAQLMQSLAGHSSAALELGSFIGRERALQYANEMLAISDALLAVKNFQQFHAVQARFRQTRVARMEIFAEMEQLLGKLSEEKPMPGP